MLRAVSLTGRLQLYVPALKYGMMFLLEETLKIPPPSSIEEHLKWLNPHVVSCILLSRDAEAFAAARLLSAQQQQLMASSTQQQQQQQLKWPGSFWPLGVVSVACCVMLPVCVIICVC